MHLRRALLLFAIVLGLAAIAASLSRPGNQTRQTPPRGVPPPTAPAQPGLAPGTASGAGAPVTLLMDAWKHSARRLQAGRPVTLEVNVTQAGQVRIPDLGMSATAEPVTPARFDLLVERPGRYPLVFTPASDMAAEAAGTLVVTKPKR